MFVLLVQFEYGSIAPTSSSCWCTGTRVLKYLWKVFHQNNGYPHWFIIEFLSSTRWLYVTTSSRTFTRYCCLWQGFQNSVEVGGGGFSLLGGDLHKEFFLIFWGLCDAQINIPYIYWTSSVNENWHQTLI